MATEVPAQVSSAADMRTNLQALLDLKEKQLQQAGALGQRVLAQQVELEDRVRMLQEMELDRPDGDEIDADMRERYRELAETVRAWDTENATLSSGFGSKVCIHGRAVLLGLAGRRSWSCLIACVSSDAPAPFFSGSRPPK